ncbi:hypothetical protein ACIBG8_41915 [Nonomuraea sp. NPDC050556]|uniref:hypothetical protein n=1 Tax=Nonomuraea sp. NPDC050556 TaxID=3364369 RepID=UPI00378CDD0E
MDVIEAGSAGRRRWLGIGVLLVLVGAGILILITNRKVPAKPAPVTPSSISSIGPMVSGANNLLHPVPRRKAGKKVIDVVFPDGRRAEVRYPPRIALDNLGARPFVGGWIDSDMMLFRRLEAPYSGEAEITRGGEAIREFAPNVTLWPRQPGSGSGGQVLMFAFGDWRLALYDRADALTFEQRVTWAEKLKGKVTKDGYLVLTATPPVRLAAPGEMARGEPVGPQLWFGGAAGDMVAIIPTPGCDERSRMPSIIGGHGRFARKVCRGDVLVCAVGEPSFVQEAIAEIRVTLK